MVELLQIDRPALRVLRFSKEGYAAFTEKRAPDFQNAKKLNP